MGTTEDGVSKRLESAREVGPAAEVSPPEPAHAINAPLALDRWAPLFVWGIWGLALLATLAFVGRYSNNFPMDDMTCYAPALLGLEPVEGAGPVGVAFLWSQHNEHRLPLPKLIWVTLLRPTHDFRAIMVFNTLALGALALAMIWAAKQLRGSTSYPDAFFPLALLNWAQYYNLLRSFQQFTCSTGLAGTLLIIIVWRGNQLRLGAAVVAGLCLVLLPLCGANGVALVPALALWLGYWGVRHWRSPEPHGRRDGLVTGGLALAALLLVPLYFRGLRSIPGGPHPGPWPTFRTGVEFLTGGFGGEAAQPCWPLSGLGVFTLMLASAAVLAVAWYRRPRERGRALGLLSFLAAMGCLALGLGWGRAAPDPGSGFESRYVTAAAPALCCAYLIWGMHGRPSSYFLQMCLFVLMVMSLGVSVEAALGWAGPDHERYEAFEKDLRAGVPLSQLAQRHGSLHTTNNPNAAGDVADVLSRLQQAGIEPFRFIQGDPGYREVPLPVVPVEVNRMTWKDGIGEGSGPDSHLVFAFRQPQLLGRDPRLVYNVPNARLVYGIRLHYAYQYAAGDTADTASFQVFWGRSARDNFGAEGRSFSWDVDARPGERTTTVWVNDTIDQFRIHPDNKPCAFNLSAITLLLPAGGVEPVSRRVPGTPFDRARAAEPITVQTCDGQEVLRVHAPSAVEFDVPARPRRRRVAGQFGILPGAYGNPEDHTDGVQFAVEYSAAGAAPRVLFERFLDPYDNSRDRGSQAFAVWLPAGDQGTVVLKAFNPPGKGQHLDWSYWTGVAIEGAEPVAAGRPPADDGEGDDERLARQVRAAVAAAVPAGATALVVSDGDLLALPGRTGWHFPQGPDGSPPGYNPGPEQAILLPTGWGR
jgi:hypothetical protein